MTGMANIGNLQIIRDDVGVLAGRFLNAFRVANPQRSDSMIFSMPDIFAGG
jgi:hypothetical protein